MLFVRLLWEFGKLEEGRSKEGAVFGCVVGRGVRGARRVVVRRCICEFYRFFSFSFFYLGVIVCFFFGFRFSDGRLFT